MSGSSKFTMTAPPAVYQRRRATLAGSLKRPLVIFAGHAPARTYPANTFPFRAGSTYLYFGGPPLEHAALLIEPQGDGRNGCLLFRPPAGPDDAVWVGEGPSDDELSHASGLARNAVLDSDRLADQLANRRAAWIAPPSIETRQAIAQLGLPAADEDEQRAVIALRLSKDGQELNALRAAARVGVEAHRSALSAVKPGRGEAAVLAAYMSALYAHGCQPSFTPIVTIRGEVLHPQGSTNTLQDGALLLVDAGAEEPGGYASDITRTVPVSGKWTAIQRHLYDTVERALQQATAACVVGARYRDVHDLAARVICEGLVAADLLRGEPDELVARAAHTLFFTHGIGHLIGLDVHDMEDFGDLAGYAPGRVRRTEFGNKFLRLDRDLQAGMTLTVEPGIYLVPAVWSNENLVGPLRDVVNRPKVDALLKEPFGGIRIENTIAVRSSGSPEVLTGALPTDAPALASAVGR